MLLFIALATSFNLLSASALKFECVNNSLLKSTFVLNLEETKGLHLSVEQGKICKAVEEEFEAPNKNYSGWRMYGLQFENQSCEALSSQVLFGEKDIYWLLISSTVQRGEKGFVQMAFENTGNYGPKVTKSFVKCFPL